MKSKECNDAVLQNIKTYVNIRINGLLTRGDIFRNFVISQSTRILLTMPQNSTMILHSKIPKLPFQKINNIKTYPNELKDYKSKKNRNLSLTQMQTTGYVRTIMQVIKELLKIKYFHLIICFFFVLFPPISNMVLTV